MKFGVTVGFNAHTPPELVAATGIAAEERGFDSIWCAEHVLFFREHRSRYPYAADGKIPGRPTSLLDPFTALTYLAAITHRIRLGTGICLVPQRNPVYTAKHVADLDFLSGGRVDFGVGIGWLREEFEALGVPWEQRIARTREYLKIMKTLWAEEEPRYDGDFHRLPDCLFAPKPVQRPHPPIFIGGNSEPALGRVAELGQGWYGHDLLPDDLPDKLAFLDRALEKRGRPSLEVERIVSPFFQPVDGSTLARYEELGIDRVLLPLTGRDVDGIHRKADKLAELTGLAGGGS